ncbi:hypothetical protein DRO69_05115 [Candidatus Bathyarchaeota archaeon]|nr:MAG: hypothetical protein DRO69_05115 [Candidatus Bathyarchaeota archaeon]
MNTLNIQKFFLLVLICIMFAPYVASLLRLDSSSIYRAEVVALVTWYLASLAIPLIMKDFDSIFVLWYFTFILVGVAAASDMVYQITRIAPANWYRFGGMAPRFYSYVKTWVLLVLPGCVLFADMALGRKMYWKPKDTAG